MTQQTFTPANLVTTPATTLVDQTFRCARCRFEKYSDHPIHGGRSIRRDCARCHRFAYFAVWLGCEQSEAIDTRREAAAAISPRVGNLRREVYRFIASRGQRGAIDEEISAALKIKEGTARARRIELRDSGHVRDSTRRRRALSGRLCIIWIAGKPLS